MRPSFSLSDSSMSAAFFIQTARCAKVVLRNSAKVRTASFSFSSSCASVSASNVFSVSPVAGLIVAMLIFFSASLPVARTLEILRQDHGYTKQSKNPRRRRDFYRQVAEERPPVYLV